MISQDENSGKKMRYRMNEEEEGLMGIGTLIIFISMILVAAVAAGVLINTAYELQQQAENTGDQAVRDVSTGFKVKSAYGFTSSSGNNITSIKLKVGLVSGSPAQNLSQTVIEVNSGNKIVDLTWANSPPTSDTYSASSVIDPEGNFEPNQPIISQGTTLSIEINFTKIGFNITPQSEVELKIIPKHGSPTLEILNVPSVFKDDIISLV